MCAFGLSWRMWRLEYKLKKLEKAIMATLDDLTATQAVTDAKLATLRADVEAKLAAGTLTPAQQAAIDAAVAHAALVNAAIDALDAEVNPPAPAPVADPSAAPTA